MSSLGLDAGLRRKPRMSGNWILLYLGVIKGLAYDLIKIHSSMYKRQP